MLTTPERNKLIELFTGFPKQLNEAIHLLSDRQLDTAYREGGWTLRQVVHHLADSHLNAYIRMRLMLTEESPTLKPYDQDLWANLFDAGVLSIEDSMSIIRGVHARMGALMAHLTDDDWRRTGSHPEIGSVTVEDILVMYARHGDTHFNQIVQLRKAKGW